MPRTNWGPEVRAAEVARVAAWRKTPQGRESTARYLASEKRTAAIKRFESSVVGQEIRRRNQALWKERHADVVRLQKRGGDAVYRALKSGRLVRGVCDICGEVKVQAHHPNGYEDGHELDIVWLCVPHHRVIHGRPVRDRRYRREDIERYLEAMQR